ncbi:MAG: aspartate aminotransferase family protein [Syntrophorhabdaceae bacterium]
MKRLIGGEYLSTPSLFLGKEKFSVENYLHGKYPGKKFNYTFGGYYSIIKILKTLGLKNENKVLIPSYLCPTILIPFDRLNIKYDFYQVNSNLEIDANDLRAKLDPAVKAVFLIDYFGFPSRIDPDIIDVLRDGNITIIEDIVQSFFSDLPSIGNIAFNSFRKFLPIDGSVIISDQDIGSTSAGSCSSYFIRKFTGQWLRYFHIRYGIIPEKWFLRLFEHAEKYYYSDNSCSFSNINRYVLSRCDIEALKMTRRKYFKQLLSYFSKQALFKNLPDNVVPLGFPIVVKNRDFLRRKLREKNIFCPVHWKLNDSIDREKYRESWLLSENILTIPIQERNTETDIQFLVSVLGESI